MSTIFHYDNYGYLGVTNAIHGNPKSPKFFNRMSGSMIDRMTLSLIMIDNMELISPNNSNAFLALPSNGVPETVRHGILGLERRAGWDGRGSRSINKVSCEAAIEFISSILARSPNFPIPRFSPSPRGGVPLTWRLGRSSLTFDIHHKNRETVDYYQSDLEYHSESGSESWEKAIERLILLRDWCAENPQES